MVALATLPDVTISIHAPREGRDHRAIGYVGIELISIHAPREGRDLRVSRSHTPARYFNPRAPRGARLGIGYELESEY